MSHIPASSTTGRADLVSRSRSDATLSPADWDFWSMAGTAVEDLRRRFRIPPLAPGDAAADDRPPGFTPIE